MSSVGLLIPSEKRHMHCRHREPVEIIAQNFTLPASDSPGKKAGKNEAENLDWAAEIFQYAAVLPTGEEGTHMS